MLRLAPWEVLTGISRQRKWGKRGENPPLSRSCELHDPDEMILVH